MKPRLSDMLVEEGLLTRPEVEEALEAQALYGGNLDTCVLELGLCDEERLEQLLIRAAGNGTQIDWRKEPPSPDAMRLLTPAEVARWRVMPYRAADRTLDLLTAHPEDLHALDEVAFKTGLRIRTSVTTELRMALLLELHYSVPCPVRFQAMGRGVPLRVRGGEPPPPGSGSIAIAPLLGTLPLDEDWNIPDEVPTIRTRASTTEPPMPSRPAWTTTAPLPPADYTPEYFNATLADFADRKAPTEVRKLHDELRRVTEREIVPRAVFPYLLQHARRAALFTVRKGLCSGWEAAGAPLEPHRVATMAFPLSHPSIFRDAAESDVYVGPVTFTQVNDEIARRLGKPKLQHAIVAPIRIRNKIVTMLACDCESERALEKAFTPVLEIADAIARTFVRLIVERKQI